MENGLDVIIWNTWKHRNEVIFKNRKCDMLEVLAVTQVNMWAFMLAPRLSM